MNAANPDRGDFDTSPVADEDIRQFLDQIRDVADKLARDHASRGDARLLATSMRELRYCFKVFSKLRGRRKVTVFGSARTKPDHPTYLAAVEFGRKIREAGYMVITGAGNGIMEAGHLGAGVEHSIGINILLPFEQSANSIIQGDDKLMSLKYFFTRKLMFVKETDAVILFAGGFGTHDEGFESLTLIQTGKSHLFPVVCVDAPGATYWKRWREFIIDELLREGLISEYDMQLFKVTDSVDEAVAEVRQFYRVYHSMRYVRDDLLLRLNRPISPETLDSLRGEFRDIVPSGDIRLTTADPYEANEPNLKNLPRLRFHFDRHKIGRLRMLVDTINRDGE